ncbi:Ras-related protein Rab-2B [Amphibalanus amphitrite]|uniref:Ras-related protein Rab-2B n=1 Tax=Amphibalanus amphitrite TaxID=1232801 RepID=A0A6A4WFY7_AMPAM|nr:Ras-related protein Rab-2B [Amphibalanus amphitrite]
MWRCHKLSSAVSSDLVLVVVGNKADLGSERAVPEALARTLAAARGAHYYETSARTNLGKKLTGEPRPEDDLLERYPR